MYRTILIPLENSPTDEVVLLHIRPLARLTGASLVLVHVADGFAARHQKALNLQDSREITDDRAYLARREDELRADGFSVTSVLETGDPAGGIIAAADRVNADLIAMGTHGHRLISDIIRGSVANELRHKCSRPILMVRERR